MDAKTITSKIEAYKIWAPDNALWTECAKPVLFASVRTGESFMNAPAMDIPHISWLLARSLHTMIVVDLPGKQGIEEGLALARLGYRPVPLYNGVIAPNVNSTISSFEIAAALYAGAETLRTLPLILSSPPVFLLDSNRMAGGKKTPGSYDNRWCVFPQDMPSAAFLSKQRIREVIVRTDVIRDDMAHILRRYQEQAFKISLCDGLEIKGVTVPKPSRFKSLFYRFKVIFGLTRNPAGGFGGLVPVSSGGG